VLIGLVAGMVGLAIPRLASNTTATQS
jgi:hypothetical protein